MQTYVIPQAKSSYSIKPFQNTDQFFKDFAMPVYI